MPNAVGRSITINGNSFMVVGVMPAAFYGVDLNGADAGYVAANHDAGASDDAAGGSLLKPDGLFWMHMMARRRPDVPVAQAQAWSDGGVSALSYAAGGDADFVRCDGKQISGTVFIPLLPGGIGGCPIHAIGVPGSFGRC